MHEREPPVWSDTHTVCVWACAMARQVRPHPLREVPASRQLGPVGRFLRVREGGIEPGSLGQAPGSLTQPNAVVYVTALSAVRCAPGGLTGGNRIYGLPIFCNRFDGGLSRRVWSARAIPWFSYRTKEDS